MPEQFIKPYVWLIGAGRLQEPISQTIQARGYAVLATDGNADAYCAKLVDKLVVLDTYDVAGHLAYAKTLTTPPMAVLTDAADVGPTVSALAEYFGLPACSYEAALATRNKAQFRRLFKQLHPRYAVYQATDNPVVVNSTWLAATGKRDTTYPLFPVVVKPADNCASRGVTKAYNAAQLIQAFTIAAQATRFSSEIILEEYLCGTEYATDWLIVDGKAILVNACARVFSGFGRELGHYNPWRPPEIVHKLASRAAQELGVTEGPFKLDWLYDKRYGWSALEGATRWSGGFDHTHSAYYATGRQLREVLLDYALGLPFDITKLAWQHKRYCVVYAPSMPVGHTIKPSAVKPVLSGQDQLHEIVVTRPGVVGVETSCADRPVFVITSSSTTDDAWLLARTIGDTL